MRPPASTSIVRAVSHRRVSPAFVALTTDIALCDVYRVLWRLERQGIVRYQDHRYELTWRQP
jgi:DNA-binding IclR family transcriptional regulator